jgi:NAD(P)-dependent dehydrogenase (short-subunit alcohol dehydrogenase family)
MSKSLENKVALITGGSRNIGRETALALAQRGADIVITYRQRKEAADQTVQALQQLGVRAAALQVDLSGTAELHRFAREFVAVLQGWGRSNFDILVNNAGSLRLGTFDSITEDDVDHIYQTNYKSVLFLTQRLAHRIADGGRIVNLGSRTANIAFAPLVSYGPLKAALQSLTLYWASFFGPRGITVNNVSPGGLDDDFNAQLFENMPQAPHYIASNTAVGRIGKPNDVAGTIAFLCEPAASFVSGATISVDGGYHL